MARLRCPSGASQLVDDVGADRTGHRRRTADRWPDTRLRVSSVTSLLKGSRSNSSWISNYRAPKYPISK